MISKELFVEVIKNIQNQEEKMDRFSKALSEVTDGYPLFDVDNLYLHSLLKVLEAIFHDDNQWIDWWLYENVEKKVWYDDGTEVKLDTPEALYDFLLQNMIDNGYYKVVDNKAESTEPISNTKTNKYEHRPRYLIIADKPLYANELKKVYETIGPDIQYDADFAWLNCLVVNINNTCHYTDVNGNEIDVVNGGVYSDVNGFQLTVEPLVCSVGDFSERYRVFHGGAYNKDADNEILELLAHNEYDAIINATDSTNENNLAFEYLLESLNMGNFPTKALAMFYHDPDSFKRELLLLNNFESECEEILDILM